jgi:hypothetical protein
MFVCHNNCMSNNYEFLEGLHYIFITFGESLMVYFPKYKGNFTFFITNP